MDGTVQDRLNSTDPRLPPSSHFRTLDSVWPQCQTHVGCVVGRTHSKVFDQGA